MPMTITITNKEIEAFGENPEILGSSMAPSEQPKNDEIKIIFGSTFIKVKLNIRKTLDNNIVISDHPSMDIIIIPSKNKIFTVPKDSTNADSYSSQDRYFKFLDKKGTLVKGTVRSGSILNSLESFYPPNNKIDVLQVLLLVTKRFLDKESEFIHIAENYEENVEDMYVDPKEEDTTELGEVPQNLTRGYGSQYETVYGILYRV